MDFLRTLNLHLYNIFFQNMSRFCNREHQNKNMGGSLSHMHGGYPMLVVESCVALDAYIFVLCQYFVQNLRCEYAVEDANLG